MVASWRLAFSHTTTVLLRDHDVSAGDCCQPSDVAGNRITDVWDRRCDCFASSDTSRYRIGEYGISKVSPGLGCPCVGIMTKWNVDAPISAGRFPRPPRAIHGVGANS